MSLVHIIYASQPFGYDSSVLAGILLDARRCNKRDGITGALLCRADVCLQMLEGPEPQVESAFARIGRDDRDANIQVLVSEAISERMFGAWSMLHDPALSLAWSREEIGAGALDRATVPEVVSVFRKLAVAAHIDLDG